MAPQCRKCGAQYMNVYTVLPVQLVAEDTRKFLRAHQRLRSSSSHDGAPNHSDSRTPTIQINMFRNSYSTRMVMKTRDALLANGVSA